LGKNVKKRLRKKEKYEGKTIKRKMEARRVWGYSSEWKGVYRGLALGRNLSSSKDILTFSPLQ
jgi:hypothetical protein